ncbi:survival motor neuron interacting protein 1-domain-containing protein [Parasitella parasitica]|nr:survival motor neuron interacting protein 1-domain-containing protein [Parasitella parasitica]
MSKRLFSQAADGDYPEGADFFKAAIPLSKKDPELVNGIPVSGEDYLLVVRNQAKKCAQTVVAPPPALIKKIQLPLHFQFCDNHVAKTEDQASSAWRKGFSKPFKSYQKFVQDTKQQSTTHKEITSIDEAYKILYTQNQDIISFIPTLSQHTILRLLKYHIQWLDKDIALKCRWMFCLLVFLDPVLTSNNISVLRDVSRECIKVRASTPQELAPLNIIISVIADVFGQSDLV